MSNEPGAKPLCFLVEWYRPDLARAPLAETAAALDAAAASQRERGNPVRLHLTLAAPRDDVLFGVFSANCEAGVQRACRAAGWAADRITADVRTHIAPCT